MEVKNSYIKNIFSKEFNTDIKGFFSKKNLDVLKRNATNVVYGNGETQLEVATVKQGMEYRPDKVAAYYLGDETLGWLITLTNSFYNGIKDYYLGRKLLIPQEKDIERLIKD